VNSRISAVSALVREKTPTTRTASASRTGWRRRQKRPIANSVPSAKSVQTSQSGVPAQPGTASKSPPLSRSTVTSRVKPKPIRKHRESITQSRVDRRTRRCSSGSATSTAGSSQRYSVTAGDPMPAS
jgi:hypothetical protein